MESSNTESTSSAYSITECAMSLNCYQGFLLKGDVESLLEKEGDFLLLRKDEDKSGVIVLGLSVRAEANLKHFVINTDKKGQLYIDSSHKEDTVSDLINFYENTQNPVIPSSKIKLKSGTLLIDTFCDILYIYQRNPFLEHQNVVVKTLKEEAKREERIAFLRQARNMFKFDHPNIVTILETAVYEFPLMIVMEYCEGGSMSSYLVRNGQTMEINEKSRFVVEAAEGMTYLERQKCMHRDIAARNCLLYGDKKTVKISGFGMSSDKSILHDDIIDKTRIKWLAPELHHHNIFSLKSDVWSFGGFMWEVFSNGAENSAGLTRLPSWEKYVTIGCPEMCKIADNSNTQMKMPDCWDLTPCNRPSITAILPSLKKFADI